MNVFFDMDQVTAFLKGSIEEFSKVTWPTRKETIRLTITVLLVSIVMGLFIGGLDFTFTNLMNTLLKR